MVYEAIFISLFVGVSSGHYDYYYYGIITVTNIFEITNSIIHNNITISTGSMWLLFIQLNIIMS